MVLARKVFTVLNEVYASSPLGIIVDERVVEEAAVSLVQRDA
jgi:hypothetical protein